MPPKNLGPCSIRDCQTNSNQYRRITENALTKAKAKGTFDQYNYLELEMQLCYPHYLSIVEPDRNDKRKLPTISTHVTEPDCDDTSRSPTSETPLSFGDKVALMTKVLYGKQRKENQILELDPDNFQIMLEDAEPLLEGFFNELYNALIPERRSAYNKKEDKKK